MDILKDIEKWAWLKYRLSGKRAMNTFIFTNAQKNNLSEEQINQLLDNLETKIKKYINPYEEYKKKEPNGIIHLNMNGQQKILSK